MTKMQIVSPVFEQLHEKTYTLRENPHLIASKKYTTPSYYSENDEHYFNVADNMKSNQY